MLTFPRRSLKCQREFEELMMLLGKRPSIDMLEEKNRTCQEQLQLLIECMDRLSAKIISRCRN